MENENKVINFENEEFGCVRAVVIDGDPWFVGKDIATILGYSDTVNALKKHVDSEDKIMGCQNATPSVVDNIGRTQYPTWINESGVYSLVFGSKLPSAKKFKRWVTSEVLPTIRKTGGYINNADLMVNTYFSDLSNDQKGLVRGLLTNISVLQNKNKALSNENDLLSQKNLEWADRALINSLVRSYSCSVGNNFGKAWNDFKKELLYKHGINLNSRITNYLNSREKKTKPRTLEMLDDSELPNAISTIVSMCRENDVDIDELLNNKSA